jgi:ubiquinone biosynthesis protein COQ9
MLPPDPTLDELAAALAPAVAANAAFDGWTPAARDAAADALGADRDVAALALPTPLAMIDAWFASVDAAMAEAVPAEALAAAKVREKIASQIEARITVLAPHRESLRRALAILALPANVAAAARLGWRTADLVWRRAGDTATDLNHTTTPASLLAIYGATVAVLLDDDSEGQATTRAFLARRIANLLSFEKAKAQLLRRGQPRLSLTRFVGRLRYPVR